MLDMQKTLYMDKYHTILLSIPFMVATKTIIDIHSVNLTVTVLEESVHFKFFDYSHIPSLMLINVLILIM